MFCAPFWKCSVWLFGRLVLCALFWMCCVRFFVTLVSCALFWMCCAGLFVLSVLRELFCMCFLYDLLRSSFVHCLLLLCPAELNESNLYNTIRFNQTWRFFSRTGAHGMRAHNSNKTADHHVRHSNCVLPCAVFCVCFVWLFGMLVPCALFWMCCVRFVVSSVFCALFWIC